MSKRNMVLLALVAAMLVVIAAGFSLHENSPAPGGPTTSEPVSGPKTE
jgi:hypothetical protein